MLSNFQTFCRNKLQIESHIPSTQTVVAQFIAYLFSEKYSPSTIYSHVSAISFQHKSGNFSDPTDSFVIKKILKGVHKLGSKPDVRLPITSEILAKLVQSLPVIFSSHYTRALLKAMFLLTYHAFLRIGELTVRGPGCAHKVVQQNHIRFTTANGREALELTMLEYKHSDLTPKTLNIATHIDQSLCPVHALKSYLALRKGNNGPLFQFADGSPVSRSFFTQKLRAVLEFNRFNTQVYKTHSFRIGAASDAATRGVPTATIQQMGRWKSDALKNYIRIHQFTV